MSKKTPIILIEPDEDEDEIEIIVKQKNKNNVTLKKKNITGKRKIKNKPLVFIDVDENISIPKKIEEKISISEKDIKAIRNTKTASTLPIITMDRFNEKFIDLLEQLSTIMLKQGEPFRSRAYLKAQETVMNFKGDITSVNQLKGLPNIGPAVMEKLTEFVETGTLRVLEKEKNNPVTILSEIYGIGPKNAEKLVEAGITSIADLESSQGLLNDIQKVGLKYHSDIIKRIPRAEIEEYNAIFASVFPDVAGAKYEIVGSYRRGAQTSGDIDVIITAFQPVVFKTFVAKLLHDKIIVEVLASGPSKCLVIAKIPSSDTYRRVDFLYAPPDEFAFAILYFTGSKIFNTVMRQHALNKCYTFNEHGIYHMVNKKKGKLVDRTFPTEKSIFDFLGLQYIEPTMRRDARDVIPLTEKAAPTILLEEESDQEEEEIIVPVKKEKSSKLDIAKPMPEIILEEVDELPISAEKDSDASLEADELMRAFQKEGIKVLEHLPEYKLVAIIKRANKLYYNSTPILTDNEFDVIKDFVATKYPANEDIFEVGAEVERNKVQLPYEMWSMDKIKPDTGALDSWQNKYNGPYVLSCKVDGVSGLYTTEGAEPKLYTRGDGRVGQDVSYLIPYLHLPRQKGIVVRGEFIMAKKDFESKYKNSFANPRNLVAGVINHKHLDEKIKDIHFVAYELIKPSLKPSEQMKMLNEYGFEVVKYEIDDEISNDSLSKLLVDLRYTYKYEIDGIIVTDDKVYKRVSGNPPYAFAFKMVLSDQVAEAMVTDVIWTPSKDGYLKPRVQISPIKLGGVTINYATGFNGAYIYENKIGIGALIQLVRSGDVIPHIIGVTQKATEAKMPNVPYKWNETHVDIMLEDAENDPTVLEKNITAFFKGIGVEGLGAGNVARIIEAGFDSVAKIINMDINDYLTVEGFKEKLATKIHDGIEDKVNDASLTLLMSASNIFGRGFSSKKIELIMKELPYILLSDDDEGQKVKDVAAIKGMAIKTAEAFVDKIPAFIDFLNDIGQEDKLYEDEGENNKSKGVDTSNSLYAKSIVLTGFRDKKISELIKSVGAVEGSSVSKNTFVVLAKSKDDDTTKAETARKLGVPIMTASEFMSTYF
jgi:NAD-dependent DNA ligase/DNA polymerase/3'-5' exonuclease PolX